MSKTIKEKMLRFFEILSYVEIHEHEFDIFVKTLDVRPIDEEGIKGAYREKWACCCGKEEIRTTVGYI